ncbi:MsnO8 family LLM class oxidoreductase [Saccharothrix syringae]|uniref:MsnO8 family LLM class oxidoreductase n=1 Tax=Saccharothrix syringae TaxID=103733 RepID=A0A5Q0H7K0_SACSY|nr:MsnO8 family LLM class oxidoreductase [Saccharothrix syringae]QFZ22196.1 MsnO8 family LLM class oxidoreductase [Saccharothrix syringae]
MKLSVLDRSRVRAGHTHAEALRDTVAFARQVEQLGYHRFWVAEHHGVPGVAGAAPTVLAAAVAAATTRIRVGTGGVMLPNHQPLVVAEQFGVLESLFPGRVDMGLGRSVGFIKAVRRALGHDESDAAEFGAKLTELLGYFTGDRPVRGYPAHGLRVAPFVLATGAGAEVAAAHGLPLVIGGFRGEEAMLEAIAGYRAGFRPSVWAAEPHVVVSATVAVAGTADEAWRLLVPEAWAMAHARTRGEFPPLRAPEDVLATPMTDRERAAFEQALRGHLFGTPHEVGEALDALVARTGAAEVLVTTSTHDRDALLTSYRLLADLYR